MGSVQFALRPGHCALGGPARLSLVVSHDLPASLHHLVFRIQTEAGLRLAGSPQAQIAEISPHALVPVELSIYPHQAGVFSLKLSRISARMGGQVWEFDDITLHIEVLPAASSLTNLISITSAVSHLEQGCQASIPLRFQNLGLFLLHNLVLQVQAEGCEPGAVASALADLPPGQVAETQFILTPKLAGSLTMQVTIQAIENGSPVTCAASLPFNVRANQRTHETHYHGDVIQIKRDTLVSLDQHSSLDAGSSTTATVTCPNCGKKVPPDKYCDLCGQPLGYRE